MEEQAAWVACHAYGKNFQPIYEHLSTVKGFPCFSFRYFSLKKLGKNSEKKPKHAKLGSKIEHLSFLSRIFDRVTS